jgi:hypothetical protein
MDIHVFLEAVLVLLALAQFLCLLCVLVLLRMLVERNEQQEQQLHKAQELAEPPSRQAGGLLSTASSPHLQFRPLFSRDEQAHPFRFTQEKEGGHHRSASAR